jgi:hypothetical protein
LTKKAILFSIFAVLFLLVMVTQLKLSYLIKTQEHSRAIVHDKAETLDYISESVISQAKSYLKSASINALVGISGVNDSFSNNSDSTYDLTNSFDMSLKYGFIVEQGEDICNYDNILDCNMYPKLADKSKYFNENFTLNNMFSESFKSRTYLNVTMRVNNTKIKQINYDTLEIKHEIQYRIADSNNFQIWDEEIITFNISINGLRAYVYNEYLFLDNISIVSDWLPLDEGPSLLDRISHKQENFTNSCIKNSGNCGICAQNECDNICKGLYPTACSGTEKRYNAGTCTC